MEKLETLAIGPTRGVLNHKVQTSELCTHSLQDGTAQRATIKVYSPKLKEYISIVVGNAYGDMQRDNVGLAPGSWY